MHIAAFSPEFITSKDIPQDRIDKEKEIATAQLTAEGKPANMIEKILVGKINKWYGEVCLMNQPWILDDKTSLAKLAPGVTVKRFARWAVGQEI
jgi:elongation factor Ts